MEVKTMVVVVDDEPGILRFVKTSLGMAGYKVVATTSGKEAVDLARTGEPDIMVLDIYMSQRPGLMFSESSERFRSCRL